MNKNIFIKVFGLLLFSFGFFLPLAQHVQANGTAKTCNRYTIPVNLSATDTNTYHIVGWLCYSGKTPGSAVELLVPGATYDHNYWDFPYNNGQYSYVNETLASGIATFSIDRLGTGLSDHPTPELLTVQSEAYPIHQIIQALRNGTFGNTHFGKVILVGHSLGSAISLEEAGAYNDEDGLIVTGWLHGFNSDFITLETNDFYPAAYDPKFANENLPLGYITNIPGDRGVFYYIPGADPNVIALDDTLKQTTTDGELGSIPPAITSPASKAIKAPVLVIIGQKDEIFCEGNTPINCANSSTVLSYETPFYTSSKNVQAFVLNYAGHDVNLHYDAGGWFGVSTGWAYSQVIQ